MSEANSESGPQVIEVVVIDSDINDTDQAKGEPDVTVNGKILRMIQAVDGNWYGYFADRTQASIADFTALGGGESTASVQAGLGLDFGTLCATGATTNAAVGFSVADTVGIALPFTNSLVTGTTDGTSFNGANGTANGAALTVQCAGAAKTSLNGTMNVVREAKNPNNALTSADSNGQIGLNSTTTLAAETDAFAHVWPSFNYTL